MRRRSAIVLAPTVPLVLPGSASTRVEEPGARRRPVLYRFYDREHFSLTPLGTGP